MESHVACDFGYCHHYGQGLWKWWNNIFLEWAGSLFYFLKKPPGGPRNKKQEASLGCDSNVLATERRHSLVYHEFKNWPKNMRNAWMNSMCKHFSNHLHSLSIKGGKCKTASVTPHTYLQECHLTPQLVKEKLIHEKKGKVKQIKINCSK